VPVVTWQQTFLDRQLSQERAAGDRIAAEVCPREGLCWDLSIPTDPSWIYKKNYHAYPRRVVIRPKPGAHRCLITRRYGEEDNSSVLQRFYLSPSPTPFHRNDMAVCATDNSLTAMCSSQGGSQFGSRQSRSSSSGHSTGRRSTVRTRARPRTARRSSRLCAPSTSTGARSTRGPYAVQPEVIVLILSA
jgi:hypothetical protein